MTMPARAERSLHWVLVFLALASILAGLQIWNAISISEVVRSAETAAGPTTPKDELEREKARQEAISKQIENQSKGVMAISLAAGLSAAIAALATILGAILALRGYLDARERERRDRLDADRKLLESREKERQDRLDTALNDTLTHLVSAEWRLRIVGAAGLLPFFTADRADFHRQALAALIAAARIKEEEPGIRQGIRLAVERAVRVVAPEVLAELSWQGVRLPEVNLVNAPLAGLDLRDAVLENARLSGANLDGADLTAAGLQGARLDAAKLRNATLTYADLAGATLAGAVLSGATLSGTKVLNLDLADAALQGLGPGWRGVPWDATRNWRQAQFDESVRAELDRIYGPAAPRLRVLMLLWEIPPMVAGGTWTACYHLVRNLRRRGADVTVVVPWARNTLIVDPPPFGVDVPIVTLDIEVPDDTVAAWSPYSSGGMIAPRARTAANSGWSPYGGGAGWSSYPTYAGGPYGSPYSGSYGAGPLAGSVLFRLIGAFSRRLRQYVVDQPVDLIHAHDCDVRCRARLRAHRCALIAFPFDGGRPPARR